MSVGQFVGYVVGFCCVATLSWGLSLPSGDWDESSDLSGYPGQPFQQVNFNNQTWIIGHNGDTLDWVWTYDLFAEIYVSDDGVHWQEGPEWPFPDLDWVKAVVFRGELYAFKLDDDASVINYVVYDPANETWGAPRTWPKGPAANYHDYTATVEVAATDDHLWFLEATNPSKLWRSDDGMTWKRVATHLPFGPRLHYRLLATDAGLAVIGGAVTNDQDERFSQYKRTTADYWFSPDGVQWKYSSSPWSTRGEMNLQRIGDIYYMIGGQNLILNHSDLWYSLDGRAWHLHCFDCPWGPLVYPLIVPHDDTIRVVGGFTGTEAKRTVWTNVAAAPPRSWIATSRGGVYTRDLSIVTIKSVNADLRPDSVRAIGASAPAYDIERNPVDEEEWRMWLPLPDEGGDVAVEVSWTDGEAKSEIIPSVLYRSPLNGDISMVGGLFGFAPHRELNGTSLAWNFKVDEDEGAALTVRRYADFVKPTGQYAKRIVVSRSPRNNNEYEVALIDLQRISLPSPREAFPFSGFRLTNSIAYDAQGNISRDNVGAASTYFMPRAPIHPRVIGINNGYFPGQENVIEVSLTKTIFAPPLGALSVTVHLPENWRYTRSIASTGTAIHPRAGTTDTLEFAWIQVPTFPVRVRLAVEVPEDESEPQLVTATSSYYLESGGEQRSPMAQYIFLGPGEIEHSADQDGDGSISFSELLRTIQLYNSGAYHVNPDSEDGFSPGDGPTEGLLHRGNYKLHEWAFDLSELLRMIQIYNSDGYVPCIDGEDGFCPSDA